MACKCNDITTHLRCKTCGWIQSISHAKGQDPLQEAVKQGRECKHNGCYSRDFEIA